MISAMRSWLYDQGMLRSQTVGRPVISVGNLTFGGTGKTPFVDHLLTFCEGTDLRAGVVSRGYKRGSRGVQEVGLSDGSWHGDEPTLFKSKHRTTPVFVGTSRTEAARALLAKYPATELLIADDAFQHRAMARQVDVVLIDALRSPHDLWMFPVGRGREPMTSLMRADFLVLNRVNLVSAAQLENLKGRLKPWIRPQVFARLIECGLKSVSPRPLVAPPLTTGATNPAVRRVLACSGLGSPEAFEMQVQKLWPGAEVRTRRFGDHHAYTAGDVTAVEKSAWDCDVIVTTEKDAVKIASVACDTQKWLVLPLVLELSSNIEILYEQMRRLAVSRS
jgi:tetraacyldisaccharide 4'-kinase